MAAHVIGPAGQQPPTAREYDLEQRLHAAQDENQRLRAELEAVRKELAGRDVILDKLAGIFDLQETKLRTARALAKAIRNPSVACAPPPTSVQNALAAWDKLAGEGS